VIWQGIPAQRARAAAHRGGWWTNRRATARRRAQLAHGSPVVIREPESAWWDAQAEPIEPAAHPLRGDPSGEGSVTVAVVGEAETGWNTDAVVSRLAELAVIDELLVVYGSGSRHRPGPGHRAVMAGLRGRLPRHHVIALHMRHCDYGLRPEAVAALENLLENGSLPVVITTAAAMHDVTAEVSSYLRADRVMRASCTVTGADLYQVWRRHPVLSAN
jgi:hypothetical protein